MDAYNRDFKSCHVIFIRGNAVIDNMVRLPDKEDSKNRTSLQF